MTDIYKKISELNSKYGYDSFEFEEELVEHFKKKFPEQYKLSLEDLKNDGSDDNLYCSGNLFLRCSTNSSSNSEDSLPYLELSSVIFLYISVIYC